MDSTRTNLPQINALLSANIAPENKKAVFSCVYGFKKDPKRTGNAVGNVEPE